MLTKYFLVQKFNFIFQNIIYGKIQNNFCLESKIKSLKKILEIMTNIKSLKIAAQDDRGIILDIFKSSPKITVL